MGLEYLKRLRVWALVYRHVKDVGVIRLKGDVKSLAADLVRVSNSS